MKYRFEFSYNSNFVEFPSNVYEFIHVSQRVHSETFVQNLKNITR